MKKVLAFVASARKALVAVVGVVAQLVAVGVLSGSALHWAQVVLAALAAAGVYAVPNKPAAKAAPVK